MKFEILERFKKDLQKAIKKQNIERFKKLLHYCPLKSSSEYNNISERICCYCPLFNEEGPRELIGLTQSCLMGSMTYIYWSSYNGGMDEKTALARLVFDGIKLLAYLENKG